MAILRKRREKWYARTQFRLDSGCLKELETPLRTTSIMTARERLSLVNKVEFDIKAGIINSQNYKRHFEWLNQNKKPAIIGFVVSDSVETWLKYRQSNGIRPSTIKRNRYSMDSFMSIVGETRQLVSVNTELIDHYRNVVLKNGLSPTSVNINLRTIKTFLRWHKVREHIDKVPHIDMVSIPKSMPLYIPDRMFEELMNLPWLKQHYKDAFWFYRETGCRLSEPFIGKLDDNWLIISGAGTKQRKDTELQLSDKCLGVFDEMKEKMNQFNGKPENWTSNLSKTFLKAIREVEGINTKYHFHCLRHTFAVRRYLQTRDIYLVKKEMGHASVTTTEIYANFSVRRLQKDFPSLVKQVSNGEIPRVGHDFVGHRKAVVSGRAVAF